MWRSTVLSPELQSGGRGWTVAHIIQYYNLFNIASFPMTLYRALQIKTAQLFRATETSDRMTEIPYQQILFCGVRARYLNWWACSLCMEHILNIPSHSTVSIEWPILMHSLLSLTPDYSIYWDKVHHLCQHWTDTVVAGW